MSNKRDPRVDPRVGDVLRVKEGIATITRRTPRSVVVDYGDGIWSAVRYGVPYSWSNQIAANTEVLHVAPETVTAVTINISRAGAPPEWDGPPADFGLDPINSEMAARAQENFRRDLLAALRHPEVQRVIVEVIHAAE